MDRCSIEVGVLPDWKKSISYLKDSIPQKTQFQLFLQGSDQFETLTVKSAIRECSEKPGFLGAVVISYEHLIGPGDTRLPYRHGCLPRLPGETQPTLNTKP